jgi:DNA polymerase-3 subunit gamma/tau
MSYQVLARKWRPRSFADMVGQAHVVRALGNALDQDRLHHAYLFTGTRGVGKTTLARILAKALNCEAGVSSTPCCQCPSCREIDEGRFVDLLEVDAASRTRVDQTRELLDNVPFAPVKGRFKVYLIDEVHMFSTSSFNALLKTLEEPPPHVKFLLATTDPQKVPVTVLSRCLQFNLKRLVPEEIGAQLAHILTVEGLPYEDQALALLARAADGSMRDGLSLLDQAIAFGGGRVGAEDIRAMLGTVGRDMSLNLLSALASRDGARLLEEVGRIHELTPDFGGLLQELLVFLHRLALFQQVPATLAADDPERETLEALARVLAPEDLQLFYQIALLGQADLPLAPDPRTGMEMVLLRMLAFRPVDRAGTVEGVAGGAAPRPGASVAPRPTAPLAAIAPGPGAERHRDAGVAASPGMAAPKPEAARAVAPVPARESPASAALAAARLATTMDKPGSGRSRASAPAPGTVSARVSGPGGVTPASGVATAPASAPVATSAPGSGVALQAQRPGVALAPPKSVPTRPQSAPVMDPVPAEDGPPPDLWADWDADVVAPAVAVGGQPAPNAPLAPVAASDPTPTTSPPASASAAPRLEDKEHWHALVAALELGGLASELARNCELVDWDGQRLRLTLDQASERLRVETTEQRLRSALAAVLGEGLRLEIQVARPEGETPSQRRDRARRERQRSAEEAMAHDPIAAALRDTLGARLMPGTVRPPG